MSKKDDKLIDAASLQKRENLLKLLKGKVQTGSVFFKEKEKQKKPCENLASIIPNAEISKSEDGAVLHRTLCFGKDSLQNEREYVVDPEIFKLGLKLNYLRKMHSDLKLKNTDLSAGDILFLDIETTGLAGGTGTYPFLICVAYFEDDKFIVQQYFMPDFPDEYAQMNMLGDLARRFKLLITYNGKTFDVPILRSRFIYHRLKSVWEIPNWDLLHSSRRLWRMRFNDCSLSTIEKEILKINRTHDIDGSLIPQLYFDYLRGIMPDRMLPVFDHNAQDVISLASLAYKILTYMENPSSEEIMHPEEQIGLYKTFSQCGEIDTALNCLERALFLSKDSEQSKTIILTLARIYKKHGKWNEALELWQGEIESRTNLSDLEPFIELAKFFEHRLKDMDKAFQIISEFERHTNLSKEFEIYGIFENQTTNKKLNRQIEDMENRKNRLMKKMLSKKKNPQKS